MGVLYLRRRFFIRQYFYPTLCITLIFLLIHLMHKLDTPLGRHGGNDDAFVYKAALSPPAFVSPPHDARINAAETVQAKETGLATAKAPDLVGNAITVS